MGYAEHPVDSPLVACTWEQTAPHGHVQRILPDACVDLIWNGEAIVIAGPDTQARVVTLSPGARLVGVRLRPGAARAILGLPASELCDLSPDATDVLGAARLAPLIEALAAGSNEHQLLQGAVTSCGAGEPDPLVLAAVEALALPGARVAPVAAELGVSARQLQRRVTGSVGYGPKLLARVLRLRRLQALPRRPLAELALDAGYADQAHMSAEVSALTGMTPVRFLKDWGASAA